MSKKRGWRMPTMLTALTMFSISIGSLHAYAEPLSFAVTLDLAQRNAAELGVLDANIDAARANALIAGRLPDPKLAVGIDNLPASGEDQWQVNRDFMTMR